MIAAAAAAMIGGAYADMVFDFTAKVTTTAAKLGSASTETMKVGHDGAFNFWYTDGVFAPNAGDPTFLDYNGTGGAVEKAVKVDSYGVGKIQIAKFKTNEAKAGLAADLAGYNYPEIYKGKEKWCFTFTYKVDGTCVRTKGSETIKTWFGDQGLGCCSATVTPAAPLVLAEGYWDSKAKVYTSGQWLLGDMTILTLYRFGSTLGTKSTNLEAVGFIGAEGVGVQPYTTIPNFAIAGQGTWGKNTAADKTSDEGIQKISGNIVGIWYEPECEICCGADASSLAWSCDLTQHNVTGYQDPEFSIIGADDYMGLQDAFLGADQWGTAAFGTFTLTFNKVASHL